MFESICIRNQSNSDIINPIDLGFLAESMLFYSDVVIIAKENTLMQLTRELGPDIFIEYLQAGHIKLQYEYEHTGIHTHTSDSSQERHTGITFNVIDHDLQNVAPKIFSEIIGRSGKARRLANRFTKLVSTVELDASILSDFNLDLHDKEYIQTAVQKLFQLYTPEYTLPSPLIFDINQVGGEFIIDTNIDFTKANKIYHRKISPSHSSLTQAYILSHILTARENLFFTTALGGDIALDPINSTILVTKIDGILDHYKKNLSRLSTFQDFVFNDGKALRESINNRSHSFKDLLKLLKQADKFRNWIKNKPPETDLLKEYFKEVTKLSWVDKLPSKSLRWSLFTGIGLAMDALGSGGLGTAVGVGISATDAFFLDKLLKGWKPNHFVEGPLKQFVNTKVI